MKPGIATIPFMLQVHIKSKSLRILFLVLSLLVTRVVTYGQDTAVFLQQAETAMQQRDYALALRWTDSALVQTPRNVSLVVQRAKLLILLERFNEAITEAEIVLSLDSNAAAGYAMRAKANMGIGNLPLSVEKEVMADLSRVVTIEPDNYISYVNRSEGFMHTRKIQEAEADLTKAIELSPALPDLYFRRGLVRNRLGFGYPEQYERAHDDFTKAISLAPKEADYYARRAVNAWHRLIKNPYDNHPKFDENDPLLSSIKADIKQALKLNPQQWLALAYRGETTYKMNMNRGKNPDKERYQSIDDLLASLQANPKENPARTFLANINTMGYPVEKLAAGLEAALAVEKAWFEKNILRLNGIESLASFAMAAERSELKEDPKFDLGIYLRDLAAKEPGNLCYQLHYYRHLYNRNFEMKEQKFMETLNKPFDPQYKECVFQMAMDLVSRYQANIFNALTPEAATENYALARKWIEKAEDIYPGGAAYKAAEVEDVKAKKDDYLAKNYKPLVPGTGTKSPRAGATPQENAMIGEYNRLVASNIPRLQGLQRSLQSSVADYMGANKMARVWMHRNIYNQCSNVINSHESFITTLNSLLKRAYGVAPSLTSEISSQIRSIESAVNRLRDVRYGLVSAL